MGLGAAAQGVFNWVQGALTYTPDLTGYPELAGFYGSMRDLGSALFVGFFMLAAIRYFLTSIGGDSAYEAIGAMRRGVVGAILLQALDPLLHGWFAAINAIAQAINGAPQGADVGTFAAQVLGLNSLIVGAAGLLAPEVLTAAILLAVVFLLLITAITVVRLTGLFVLACLYVVAPVCLVTWISPDFKGIARWWFASFVTYSLWGIAYALVLKVDVILLTSQRRAAQRRHGRGQGGDRGADGAGRAGGALAGAADHGLAAGRPLQLERRRHAAQRRGGPLPDRAGWGGRAMPRTRRRRGRRAGTQPATGCDRATRARALDDRAGRAASADLCPVIGPAGAGAGGHRLARATPGLSVYLGGGLAVWLLGRALVGHGLATSPLRRPGGGGTAPAGPGAGGRAVLPPHRPAGAGARADLRRLRLLLAERQPWQEELRRASPPARSGCWRWSLRVRG